MYNSFGYLNNKKGFASTVRGDIINAYILYTQESPTGKQLCIKTYTGTKTLTQTGIIIPNIPYRWMMADATLVVPDTYKTFIEFFNTGVTLNNKTLNIPGLQPGIIQKYIELNLPRELIGSFKSTNFQYMWNNILTIPINSVNISDIQASIIAKKDGNNDWLYLTICSRIDISTSIPAINQYTNMPSAAVSFISYTLPISIAIKISAIDPVIFNTKMIACEEQPISWGYPILCSTKINNNAADSTWNYNIIPKISWGIGSLPDSLGCLVDMDFDTGNTIKVATYTGIFDSIKRTPVQTGTVCSIALDTGFKIATIKNASLFTNSYEFSTALELYKFSNGYVIAHSSEDSINSCIHLYILDNNLNRSGYLCCGPLAYTPDLFIYNSNLYFSFHTKTDTSNTGTRDIWEISDSALTNLINSTSTTLLNIPAFKKLLNTYTCYIDQNINETFNVSKTNIATTGLTINNIIRQINIYGQDKSILASSDFYKIDNTFLGILNNDNLVLQRINYPSSSNMNVLGGIFNVASNIANIAMQVQNFSQTFSSVHEKLYTNGTWDESRQILYCYDNDEFINKEWLAAKSANEVEKYSPVEMSLINSKLTLRYGLDDIIVPVGTTNKHGVQLGIEITNCSGIYASGVWGTDSFNQYLGPPISTSLGGGGVQIDETTRPNMTFSYAGDKNIFSSVNKIGYRAQGPVSKLSLKSSQGIKLMFPTDAGIPDFINVTPIYSGYSNDGKFGFRVDPILDFSNCGKDYSNPGFYLNDCVLQLIIRDDTQPLATGNYKFNLIPPIASYTFTSDRIGYKTIEDFYFNWTRQADNTKETYAELHDVTQYIFNISKGLSVLGAPQQWSDDTTAGSYFISVSSLARGDYCYYEYRPTLGTEKPAVATGTTKTDIITNCLGHRYWIDNVSIKFGHNPTFGNDEIDEIVKDSPYMYIDTSSSVDIKVTFKVEHEDWTSTLTSDIRPSLYTISGIYPNIKYIYLAAIGENINIDLGSSLKSIYVPYDTNLTYPNVETSFNLAGLFSGGVGSYSADYMYATGLYAGSSAPTIASQSIVLNIPKAGNYKVYLGVQDEFNQISSWCLTNKIDNFNIPF